MRICFLELVAMTFVVFLAVSTLAWPGTSGQSEGLFSRNAVVIWGQSHVGKTVEIKAPDDGAAIVAQYSPQKNGRTEEINVYLDIGKRHFRTAIGDLVDSEVMWAPDSKAFALTFSDGGNVGTFHTQIYQLEEHGFRVEEPTTYVRKAYFSQKLVCFEPEPPNIVAIRWLGSSKKILLAAEIPPDTNCDDMGTFKTYAISLPGGRILRTYGQIQAKHLFKRDLGPELKNADDNCILKPKSCRIPALHAYTPASKY